MPREWSLNNVAEVIVAAPVERVWAALTNAADTEYYFQRARVTVGDVGEAYRLERDDGWRVDGIVLAKEVPHRLRVTWRIKTPPDLAMPNYEIEYLVEPVPNLATQPRTRLTVSEYVDGPLPASLANASRTGWVLITRSLEDYLARDIGVRVHVIE